MSEDHLVLVVREKPRRRVYVRSMPETAFKPTPAQIQARIAFGEAARLAKGLKMTGSMPPAAEMVKKVMAGLKFKPSKRREPKWVKVLEERARELGIAGEMVKTLLEAVKRG